MTDKLKPCPFCGESVKIVRIGGGYFWTHTEFKIRNCPIAHSRKYDTVEEVIEAWNRRANNDR